MWNLVLLSINSSLVSLQLKKKLVKSLTDLPNVNINGNGIVLPNERS